MPLRSEEGLHVQERRFPDSSQASKHLVLRLGIASTTRHELLRARPCSSHRYRSRAISRLSVPDDARRAQPSAGSRGGAGRTSRSRASRARSMACWGRGSASEKPARALRGPRDHPFDRVPAQRRREHAARDRAGRRSVPRARSNRRVARERAHSISRTRQAGSRNASRKGAMARSSQ